MSKKDVELIASVFQEAEYVRMRLADIHPAPYNPRKDLQPEDEEYQQIRHSINDHGLLQPIVFNKRTGNAVGGNQRLKILENGGVEEAMCAVIDVTLAKEKRINIALNNIGNMWDQPKLRTLMMELRDSGYDLKKTAFTDYEIGKITQGFDAAVDSFFTDDEEDDKPAKHVEHTYQCPYCGEVFTK